MTYAKTSLAKTILKNKGFNPAWLSTESPLTHNLQNWIIDTLTQERDMTTFSYNPHLILLILNCCHSNYSPRNVHKLIKSDDFQKIIVTVVKKHFPANHTFYLGNDIDNPKDLCNCARGILLLELDKKKGFKDEWMTFEISRVIGTLFWWVQHRLHDYMKSNKDGKSISMSATQRDDYTHSNHEETAQVQSIDQDITQGIDDLLIYESEENIKQMLSTFVMQLPIIAITQTTSLIENSDASWNLFMRLNPLNILQWLMSNPLYYHNAVAFDLLCKYADIPPSVVIAWKNNLPELVDDVNSSSSSHGTKAKNYTLLAFSSDISTIEALRSLPDIQTQRETLRRRNNNTHAGVYVLCLLSCLTIKGSNPIGVQLLESLSVFYHASAMKIVPEGRWLLTEELVKNWAQSNAGLSDIKAELFNIIALVRYETNFESLKGTKRANVFKIHRIIKNIGQQIANYPSVPFESR